MVEDARGQGVKEVWWTIIRHTNMGVTGQAPRTHEPTLARFAVRRPKIDDGHVEAGQPLRPLLLQV